MTEIVYPHNPENNVKYEYGAYNIGGSNEAGRITKQLDASGLQQFWYGNLGEIIKNTHSFVLPHDREITFTTLFKYDTWNRMKKVTYPDGEVVTYKYNNGGLLKSMRSFKSTQTYKYVNDVHYDKFEKRTYMWGGNGTKTNYYYNTISQKLSQLVAIDSIGSNMMNKTFSYDNTDNITQISDIAPRHFIAMDTIGGTSTYNYLYDSLYRLVTANGTCQDKNKTDNYTLGMAYSASGLIRNKNQGHTKNGITQTATTYSNNYTYSTKQPHAAIRIGNMNYNYNANGDMIKSTDVATGKIQHLRWDEENRLKLFCDHEQVGSYLYDAGGERYLKILGTHVTQIINGNTTIQGYGENGQTLYVSPFMVVSDKGYTKHFYIEGERIASKIGDGMNISGTLVNDTNTPSNLKWYRPYVGFNNDSTIRGFNLQSSTDYDNKTIEINGMLDRDLDSIAEGHYFPFTVLLAPVVSFALTQNNIENQRYFFHPDHLGSSNYVSDVFGLPSERLEYFPFGEILVNENRTTYSTPYKFSAKELDEESQLSYFGARYYDSRGSIWLGVDALLFKSPNESPYVYCKNNPIRYIDEDGLSAGDIYNLNGKHIGDDGIKDQRVYLKLTKDNTQLTQKQSLDATIGSHAAPYVSNTIDQTTNLGLTNNELNLRASLSTLKKAEAGRSNPALNYNSWNHGRNFINNTYENDPDAYKSHPHMNTESGSSAAGAYQAMDALYKGSFSPINQDRFAVGNMTTESYLASFTGNMNTFRETTKGRWTSLNKWSVSDLQKVFEQYRANELTGKSNIATPIGNLLRKK